jgi:hypothetical protein
VRADSRAGSGTTPPSELETMTAVLTGPAQISKTCFPNPVINFAMSDSANDPLGLPDELRLLIEKREQERRQQEESIERDRRSNEDRRSDGQSEEVSA